MKMHLVQIATASERRVALVQEPHLRLLSGTTSVLELATLALSEGRKLSALVLERLSEEFISYDDVYKGGSPWKLLTPIDVPGDPQKLLVSGTGLTHLGSARERQAMHVAARPEEAAEMTDSMRMFEWGRQGGKPAPDQAGVAPEWFYKGDGSVLQAPFAPLEIPAHAEDGGEEAELAAIYVVGDDGTPYRIGMAAGNEFSDHVFEKRNYLNLAGSKLRMCSLGPELVVDAEFRDIRGHVQIRRGDAFVWQKEIRTGEENMCHSLANLEHHHFKFAGHRQAGTVHVHFLGADALSFGHGIRLVPEDVSIIEFQGFGRALQNPVAAGNVAEMPVRVRGMS